jgi:16S rRNA (uracil1498-N3)-methyltransferase
VLRLRPGERVTASDGRGGWRQCRFIDPGRLEPEGEPTLLTRPAPPVTVGFALTKGDRPEWVVQKLTEVGVDRIVPFLASRTVVRWDEDKAGQQVLRLRAIARAAAMQSRRAWLPVVDDVSAFGGAVNMLGGNVALAQPGGQPPGLDRPAVLVGPEGGFAEPELALGLATVDLGPTVLRAETAAIACGVLLCSLRAGLVDGRDGHRPRPDAGASGSGRWE